MCVCCVCVSVCVCVCVGLLLYLPVRTFGWSLQGKLLKKKLKETALFLLVTEVKVWV